MASTDANRAPDNDRYTKNLLVVAPGLIVYDRLRDAFEGKERDSKRDFATSDLATFHELFIPNSYRDEIFRFVFVQGAVCPKEEIGRKVTAGGLIAIANWHVLSEETEEEDQEESIVALGDRPDPAAVVNSLLPLTPGTSQGNDLNVLNRRYERGSILNYLRGLPSLIVFNDEAHHIHEFKREGEVSEVEWQKSLTLIAEPKATRFMQVDFSATPYNEVGAGKNAKKTYFPHIVVDFDLKTAMRQGLVKSLVLDKRSEIGALSDEDLEFRAYRDEQGNPQLSEGQRVMLRAGITKLRMMETDFAEVDPARHPKMLVVCEDTSATPLVEDFLRLEGLCTKRTALFARYRPVGGLIAALGALAAGLPDLMVAEMHLSRKMALQAMFMLYGIFGLLSASIYATLPKEKTARDKMPAAPLTKSKRIVYTLAALFSLDAFAGGFVVQSMLALWLFQKFQLSTVVAGTIFFWAGIFTALSYLAAVRIAAQFGLVNTMVFSHLAANILLILIPFMPTLGWAIALLLARSLLSQMDVPTRSSYVMPVVLPEERTAAASITSVPRSLASAAGPFLTATY